MRPQSILVAALALVFGGSAAVGVRQYVGLSRTVPKTAMVRVVVAGVDIPRGTLVSADLVKTREFPKDLVPRGAILKPEDAVERSAFTTLVKDEPIHESRLSPKGQRGLAAQVPKGMRAFTINTPNVAAGVAGFILPGNKVDVLLTVTSGSDNDGSGGGSTTTLLQNLEILAVDQRMEAPAENKVDTQDLRSVTLLVTPDQAAKLDLGQNKGTLHLSLRNPNDDDQANTRPAILADLRYRQEPPSQSLSKFLAAIGRSLAQSRPVPQEKPAVPEKPAIAKVPENKTIRTLRGGQEGLVIITPATVVANNGD